jgi:nitrite reductase/ring-hydroxylating ferredoxin subunit
MQIGWQFFFILTKYFSICNYDTIVLRHTCVNRCNHSPFCYFCFMMKIRYGSKILSIRTILFSLLFTLSIGFPACTENQNNFVPYAKVDKYISLINYNNLLIPGNSMTFPAEGYAGLIIICVSDQTYLAFDACCPLEGMRTSIVETNPGQTGIVSSSNPVATCKICGSQYILYNGGYPVKGPSTRNLKQYPVTVMDSRLWIHN